MLHDFRLAGRKVRLWQRNGESYEHILMKALGYAMFITHHPNMQVEHPVGLRYKPDLVAQDEDGRFRFWGECGQVSLRKINWLMKHAGVEHLVVFKIGSNMAPLANELRNEIPAKYRAPGRIEIFGFSPDIVHLTIERRISYVPSEWYAKLII